MAGALGGGAQSSAVKRISAFQVQSSAYGNVIPKAWGRGRVAINLMWLDGFFSKKHEQQYGKGGNSGGDSFSYYADIILGICDTSIQPIVGVNAVYRDQEVVGPGTGAGFAGQAKGVSGQAYWSYLDSYSEDVRLGYDTIAYLFASAYQLSDSATLQNHSVEVQFTWHPGAEGTVFDALPGDEPTGRLRKGIISSFLLDCIPQWTADYIGDLKPLGTACLAQGLLLSPVLDTAQQASSVLDEWLTACNARCWVRGDGTFQVKPLADEPVTGNGVTYAPDMTPIYQLTDDDFIVDDPADDPIQIDTENLNDLWNRRTVSFKDRDHQYDDNTAPSFDQGSIDEFGERKADPTSLPCIKNIDVARLAAQLLVQQTANFARPFIFNLPWWADLLEEMDMLAINSASMGLNNLVVRIKQIDEDADTGKFTIHADEVLIGTGTAPKYNVQHAMGGGISRDGDGNGGDGGDGGGGDGLPPQKRQVLFNPPLTLTNGQLQVWGAVNSLDPTFGGVDYWAGFDGASFDYIGRSRGRATFGSVIAGTSALPDFDETSVLDVDLSDSKGALTSATIAGYSAAARLCWVNGEIIAYREADLIGPYQYRLTGLRRGLYGTEPQSHTIGQQFVLLDDQLFKIPYLPEQSGKTVFVKTATFNHFGKNVQNLAGVEAEEIALS